MAPPRSRSRARSVLVAPTPGVINLNSIGLGASEAKSYFEQQREMLLLDIANSFEQVLVNLNQLNRGLEATIAVGNEFSSVEALWSQFENVMVQQQPGQQGAQPNVDEKVVTEQVADQNPTKQRHAKVNDDENGIQEERSRHEKDTPPQSREDRRGRR